MAPLLLEPSSFEGLGENSGCHGPGMFIESLDYLSGPSKVRALACEMDDMYVAIFAYAMP